MPVLFFVIFGVAVVLSGLAMVLSIRVTRQGAALIAWVKHEFPDAFADMASGPRIMNPAKLVRWLDENIEFPDEEFAQRRAAFEAARRRANIAFVASLAALGALTLYAYVAHP